MRVLYKGSFKIKWLDQPSHRLVFFSKPSFLSYSTFALKFGCILYILCPRTERMKSWTSVRVLTAWEGKGELMQFSVKQGGKGVWEHQSCTWKTLLESLWHKEWWQVLAQYDKTTNGSLNWKSTPSVPTCTQTFSSYKRFTRTWGSYGLTNVLAFVSLGHPEPVGNKHGRNEEPDQLQLLAK